MCVCGLVAPTHWPCYSLTAFMDRSSRIAKWPGEHLQFVDAALVANRTVTNSRSISVRRDVCDSALEQPPHTSLREPSSCASSTGLVTCPHSRPSSPSSMSHLVAPDKRLTGDFGTRTRSLESRPLAIPTNNALDLCGSHGTKRFGDDNFILATGLGPQESPVCQSDHWLEVGGLI